MIDLTGFAHTPFARRPDADVETLMAEVAAEAIADAGLEPADIDAICRLAIERRLDALIVSNTTITRPPLLSNSRLMDFRPSTAVSSSASVAAITGSRVVFWLQPASSEFIDSG